MMVCVEFVDRNGVSGVVDTELTVEYDGTYREVETYVNAVRDEFGADNGQSPPEDAFEELLIDLPQKLPVQEVHIREERST